MRPLSRPCNRKPPATCRKDIPCRAASGSRPVVSRRRFFLAAKHLARLVAGLGAMTTSVAILGDGAGGGVQRGVPTRCRQGRGGSQSCAARKPDRRRAPAAGICVDADRDRRALGPVDSATSSKATSVSLDIVVAEFCPATVWPENAGPVRSRPDERRRLAGFAAIAQGWAGGKGGWRRGMSRPIACAIQFEPPRVAQAARRAHRRSGPDAGGIAGAPSWSSRFRQRRIILNVHDHGDIGVIAG